MSRSRGGRGCGVPPGWHCCPATRSASPKSLRRPTLEPPFCSLLGPLSVAGYRWGLTPPPTPTPRPARPEMPREGPREGTGQADSLVFSLRVQRAAPRSCRFTAGLGPQCSGQRDVTRRGAEFPVGLGGVWGGVAPERGIPSQSLIPARPLPLFPVPAPSCRAWNWVWGGLYFQSCLLQQAGRQARLSCTPSSPFLSLRAVPRAGLRAWVVRDQRWASQEEPSAKGRPPRIRPAAAGSATWLGPRGGHLGSQGCRIKAWAGKGRAVGTFEAGSPWKSHGLKQELPTPQPPRAVLSASEAAGVPRTRLESPHLVQQALTPKPSVLCFQLLLCPLGVGAPPPPVPYSRQPPAEQVSFLEGQEGKHPAGSSPLLSCRQTALPAARGRPWGGQRGRRRLFSHGGWAAASHLLPGGRCLVGCWRWAKLSVPEAFQKVSPVSGGRDSRKPTPQPVLSRASPGGSPPDKETRSREDGQ